MTNSWSGSAQQGMEGLFREGIHSTQTDEQLLDRFLEQGDETSFTVLVHRHGPMVWGICQRLLRNPHDSGEAFQATFLVLARRAGSFTVGASLAPWLHGVTVRVARRARVVAIRRRERERTNMDIPDVADRLLARDDDLRASIDEELRGLPGRYQSPLILCYLEGLTHEEAALRLECPVGTVRSRLARGRDLLRSRLLRRGLAPSTSALIASWLPAECQATRLESLYQTTVQAATRLAAGQTLAETVSVSIATLVVGATRTMTLAKLSLVATALTIPLLGVAVLAAQKPNRQTQKSSPAPAPKPSAIASSAKPDKEKSQEAKNAEKVPNIKDLEVFGRFPPFVLQTIPAAGSVDVDPALAEIRITFSKRMMDKNWSVVKQTEDTYPEFSGPLHYDSSKRTFILPVKLEPDKSYALWLNTPKFGNLKDADGRSAAPYFLVFHTKAP